MLSGWNMYKNRRKEVNNRDKTGWDRGMKGVQSDLDHPELRWCSPATAFNLHLGGRSYSYWLHQPFSFEIAAQCEELEDGYADDYRLSPS